MAEPGLVTLSSRTEAALLALRVDARASVGHATVVVVPPSPSVNNTPRSIVDAVLLWVAAAANSAHDAPIVLLLTPGASSAAGVRPAGYRGWSGAVVSAAVKALTDAEALRSHDVPCAGWQVYPPVALVPDAACAAPPATLAVALHVLTASTLGRVPSGMPDVLDEFAQYVLLLEVRPSPVLVVFAHVKDGKSSKHAVSADALAAAAAATRPMEPAGASVSYPCKARTVAAALTPLSAADARDRIARALVFDDVVAATSRGAASAWPPAPLLVTIDLAYRWPSEGRAADWKSAGAWLDRGAVVRGLKECQDDAIICTTFRYAVPLLNVQGGGELVFGVSEATGGIEGVVNVPAERRMSYAEELATRMRSTLRATLRPWRDTWLRIVPVEVAVTEGALLRARSEVRPGAPPVDVIAAGADAVDASRGAGDCALLVASFSSRLALVRLRQALATTAPCASLPLPLLSWDGTFVDDMSDEGDAGVFDEPLRVVFRAPTEPEDAAALRAELQTAVAAGDATLSTAAWSEIEALLPGLLVLRVQFRASAAHAAAAAVCSRFDVAAPVLPALPPSCARRPDYLAWADITARIACEAPAAVLRLNAMLTQSSASVICWNVSADDASRRLFASLCARPAAAAWTCADVSAAVAVPADWGCAMAHCLDAGDSDVVLLLVCVGCPDGGGGATASAAAARAAAAANTLTAAPNARVVVIVDSAALGCALLEGAANAVMEHGDTDGARRASNAFRRGMVVPAVALERDGMLAPPSSAKMPQRLDDVHATAAAFLCGRRLPHWQLQQLLGLPPAAHVDFARTQGVAVAAAVDQAVASARSRGGVHPVAVIRRHVSAGAATLALRSLADRGCAPCLLGDSSDAEFNRLRDWVATLPTRQLLGVVVRGGVTDAWVGPALGGRAAVVVHVVDGGSAPSGGVASTPPVVVSGALTDAELRDAVARFCAVLPRRRESLAAFERVALLLPPHSSQRSVLALAVAAHMDAFVPLFEVLGTLFPPLAVAGATEQRPLSELPDGAVCVLAAALFHAFDVNVGAAGAPRLVTQVSRTQRLWRAWHLIGYVPPQLLPVTAHAGFAGMCLRAAAARYVDSSYRKRMLALVGDVLCWLVAHEDVRCVDAAWLAAIRRTDDSERFSNVVDAAYRECGAAGAAKLVNRVRGALGSSPQAAAATAGAHLLIIASCVWRMAAQDAARCQLYDEAMQHVQVALKYAILALRHWGSALARTCLETDVGGSPIELCGIAAEAVGAAPEDAVVARHWTATVLADCGAHVGRALPDLAIGCVLSQEFVALALATLSDLRRGISGMCNASHTARAALAQYRDALVRLQTKHPDTVRAALRGVHTTWAGVLHLPADVEGWLSGVAAEDDTVTATGAAGAGAPVVGGAARAAPDERFAALVRDPGPQPGVGEWAA